MDVREEDEVELGWRDTPGLRMLFRLRPGADEADVATAHERLRARSLDDLRRSIAANTEALEREASAHEQAALRGGLSVLCDEVEVREGGANEATARRNVAVRRWLTNVNDAAHEVVQAAADLVTAAPGLAAEVEAGVRRTGRPVEQVAARLAALLATERARDPVADAAASRAAGGLQRLDESAQVLGRVAGAVGGLTARERQFLADVRQAVWTAARWVPPLGLGAAPPAEVARHRLDPAAIRASPIMDVELRSSRAARQTEWDERHRRAVAERSYQLAAAAHDRGVAR